MSSLSRLLSVPAVIGVLFAAVVPAGAQSSGPGSQFVGSAAVGQTASLTFTVNTDGNSPLVLQYGTNFSIATSSCVPDDDGVTKDCTVTATFTPAAPGLYLDAILQPEGSDAPSTKVFLSGTGTAPQLGFNFGTPATYSPSIPSPNGVAIGPDGSFYVSSNASPAAVYRFNHDGTGQTTLDFAQRGITPIKPGAIAVDGAGTVYVADTGTNQVYSLINYGVEGTVSTSQLSNPVGIAVDGAGSLYIADAGNSRIIKIDSSGNESNFLSEVPYLVGIALDAAGNIYYAQYSDTASVNQISRISSDGGNPVNVGQSNRGAIQGLAVDAAGSIYLATVNGLVVIAQNTVTDFGFIGGGPVGVAVDPQGNVYQAFQSATNSAANVVTIYQRGVQALTEGAQIGQSGSGTVTMQNTGTGPLSFTSFVFSDPAFSINDGSNCIVGTPLAADNNCQLTITFTPTTPKTYNATLTITSNSLNGTATTTVVPLTGDTPTSTTSLSLSPSSATTGQLVTFTAVVSASYYNGFTYTDVTPTGTVSFFSGQTNLGAATLSAAPNGGQEATFSTNSLAPGTYSVTAVYQDLSVNTVAGSTSSPVTLVVSGPAAPATTTTTLSVSSANIAFGSSETLTAAIAGAASPALGGTVTFYDGSNMLGTGSVTATATGGTATFTTTTLAVGTHQLTAIYGGDTNYGMSTSTAQTVTVTAATLSTVTTLTQPATVAYKTPIALTAGVADSNANPVTAGQVFFCDASAPTCNAVLNLGVAQLTSTGSAVLTIPSATIGNHTYKAIFLARTGYSTSTSATQSLTVTGIYPSSTTLASAGNPGSYSLTATVVGLGDRTAGPGGIISFIDTTNANQVLGTAPLSTSTLGFTTAQPTGSPFAVGAHPYGIATGDFNGDGYADVVTGNYGAASVSVLLGKGNGTFQAAVTYAAGGDPERVLVTDVNGDGKADLIVANTASGTVSVLLGNGDGTFQTQVTYSTGSPVGLGVMDLNHDGFPDIVAGNYYGGSVSVLINNGDGTFKAAVNYTTGSTPQTLAEGDFDGDGNVDLAVGNLGNGNVGIFLGNGDGTFQAQVTYAVGRGPQGVQVGDFNGDGIEDLAVSNSTDNTISVLIGKGDGTFQTQVTYPVGSDPVGLVIADFNGDGFQDLSTGNTAQSDLTQSILFGNGDGTFQPQVKFPTGNFPYGQAAADFDGDGYPDLAIADFNDSTATILLSQVTQTATATLTPVNVTGAAGTHTVDVSYPADANFAASVSPTIPLVSAPSVAVASTTSLTIAPLAATVGQNVLFTVSVAGAGQTTPVPTGTVTLASTGTGASLGSTSITLGATGAGSFSSTQIPVGTYSVTASYSGDANYAASLSAPMTLTVSLAPQTITFPAIPSHAVNDAPFSLAATASSGLAVTYNVVSGPATVSGSTVTLTGTPGTVVIRASQPGNTSYAAATSVTQSFTVSLATQTITFPAIPSHTIEDAPFTVSATASSGLAVTYTLVSGPATLSGNTVTLAGTTGTVVLQASQAGNTTYAAATSVTQSFTVSGALVPTLTAITPSAIVTGSAATTVTLTGTNFNSVDVLRLNGATTIATTFVNATTLTAVLPASALVTAGTIQVAVNDLIGKTTSNALSITVSNTPAVVFSGPTTPPASGQQPTLTFQLTNPYPVPLTASFNLLFTPSTTPAVDDPAIQFANGGRNYTFTVAANSVVTPAIQLQAGTEAGTITVPVTLTAQGVDVTPANLTPVVIVIPPAAPVVNLVTMNTSGGGVNVVVTGYSNTREATQAKFHFTAASGADLNTPDLTANITPLFTTWYGSAASAPYGSTVVYTQSFTLDSGTASNITGVTVTLTNSVGTSNAGSSQ